MKKRLFCIALMVWMLCVCVMTVQAQSGTVTSIVFSNENAAAEENLSLSGYGDKDSGYATSTVGGRLYASVSGTDLRKLEWSKGEYGADGMQPVMTGGTKNPWGSGAYIELRVSTKGYEDVTFSAKLGATNKGPRDYKLQYSTDGVTFYDVPGALYTVPVNKTMAQAFDGVALPAAADNAEMLYIRITVASNMMVNGTAGLIGSTGGETAINRVVVEGVAAANTASTSADDTTSTTVANETNDEAVSTQSVQETTTTEAIPNVNTGESDTVYFMAAALLLSVVTVAGASITCIRRKG